MSERAHFRTRQGGSALVMAVVAIGIVIAAIVLGTIVYLLFFSQKRAQSQADAFSLSVVQVLNYNDRIGKMNYMEARARELVYVSRDALDFAGENYPHLVPIVRMLVEEAREGARSVQDENERLNKYILSAAVEEAKDRQKQAAQGQSLRLPGMQVELPQLKDISVGYVKDVLANVEPSSGIPELVKHDVSKGYVQVKANLFAANIDAKLPPPDNDLIFKISSLAAPVKGSVAPCRLATPQVFKSVGYIMQAEKPRTLQCTYLPSALKLDMEMKVKTGDQNRVVSLSAVAVAEGGTPASALSDP